ncbi:ATPase [Pseudomonas sp. 10B1]|uniref:ATPase n=1 Tax=unclassified Pseudomonas TaxID=196821 RepID=UPI002B239ED5|nr:MULTISPECIES: ATPase [unclassified Pseudomonas]MEA9978918.1 ATPase [Pseudomonas sp. RTS4]MEA9995379.1 ATPase [Pseudomonas sp. AA4]MEB0087283.1 ATPase [Pseudomonas sp. RTI1]MEB0127485.1 ATPase [Pseudomonas sp. CCC1.2]MEB0153578.1 ATPase [Pseudomonas sp. CCC4.3]
MRNDPHDDFDDVPHLSAKDDEDDDFVPAAAGGARDRNIPYSRTAPAVVVKRANTGPIWALVGALFIAFAGLAWWSFQQTSLMEQQLVATQESFARISEDAAGRLKDISGKVVATESVATNGSEAMKLQLQKLESKLNDQSKQQEGVAGQQSGLDKRLQQMSAQTTQLQTANAQLQDQVKSLTGELNTLKGSQPDSKAIQSAQALLDAQLKTVSADVAALKKQSNPSVAIDRLEQELLVLKSQQDNRPTGSAQGSASTAEFDAFRGQVTRNINTLQSQIQNLQQQITAKQ